jgi:hypothetical protein
LDYKKFLWDNNFIADPKLLSYIRLNIIFGLMLNILKTQVELQFFYIITYFYETFSFHILWNTNFISREILLTKREIQFRLSWLSYDNFFSFKWNTVFLNFFLLSKPLWSVSMQTLDKKLFYGTQLFCIIILKSGLFSGGSDYLLFFLWHENKLTKALYELYD